MCSPASAAFFANSGSDIRIPLLAICTWVKPISLALRTIRKKSGCIVGSPPVNWTAVTGTGFDSRSVVSISTTIS